MCSGARDLALDEKAVLFFYFIFFAYQQQRKAIHFATIFSSSILLNSIWSAIYLPGGAF